MSSQVGDKRPAPLNADFTQVEREYTTTKKKTKLASECEHTDRTFYSKGLCQACYLV